MSNRIIVGVDGSAHSIEGLRWSVGHAKKLGDTTVVAILAWQVPLIGIPGAFDLEELEDRAKGYLNETVAQAVPEPEVAVERIVAQAEPTTALVEASRGADLLVVGTRGRNPFSGLLLGSVSQGCAASAYCPVVIVKLQTADAHDGASAESAGRTLAEG